MWVERSGLNVEVRCTMVKEKKETFSSEKSEKKKLGKH
jgi:hypothetical protein